MKNSIAKLALISLAFYLSVSARVYAQESKGKAVTIQQGEALRGVRPMTRSAVILIPVSDKSGQGSALAEFATEVINQSVRNGGIKTVAWFKVERALKKELAAANPYSISGASGLVNDSNMNEVILSGKKLGARYVLRPVILKQSNNSNRSGGLKCIPFIGCVSSDVKITNNAEVDVKVDIISVKEEDIIASKTFSGRSTEVNKERANRLDGITGMQIFSGASQTDSTKVAFYDTIDKIVDFLQDKTQ